MSTDPEHVEEARDHELEKEPERNCAPTPGTRSTIHSPEPDPLTNQPVLQRFRYPLNSRRLTAAHLRAIAEAIGLPTADQLRQCIEGKLQTEREDPNVVVIIREVQTTEQIIALADAGGEFVRTPPLRHGQEKGKDTSEELQEARTQLQEAEEIIQSARTKDEEQAHQIAELQDALLEQEQQITERFEGEVADLKQKLTEEKTKLRQSWKTSCEQLIEQDALIAAKDEEIAELKCKLAELTAGRATHRPPPTVRVEPPSAIAEDTAVLTRPPPLPGASHHSQSGARTRHASSGDTPHDSTLRETTPWTDRPPPGDLPTITSPPYSLAYPAPGGHPHYGEHVPSDLTRRGRAPPIQFFSGEDPAVTVDDWLPSLERASAWNGWSITEKLMQLPAYLKGRALQEWSLLGPTV